MFQSYKLTVRKTFTFVYIGMYVYKYALFQFEEEFEIFLQIFHVIGERYFAIVGRKFERFVDCHELSEKIFINSFPLE